MELHINKETTASFDVDPQNGFTPLCPNELPVNEGHLIADELNLNATFARIRVGSKDAHPANPFWKSTEEKPTFTPVEGEHRNLDIHWTLHCVVGTYGFELLDKLPDVQDYDFFVYKGLEKNMHPYGACYHDLENKMSTGVIEFLKVQNIETVIVGGLATDYCVANTALQLADAGFQVIVNLKSCRGIAEETINSAIATMQNKGIIIVESLESL